jgi:hypothetical protein
MRRPAASTGSGAEPGAGRVGHMPARAPGVCELRAWMPSASSTSTGREKGLPLRRPGPRPRRPARRFTRRGEAAARRSDTGAARVRPDMDAIRREADGMRLQGFSTFGRAGGQRAIPGAGRRSLSKEKSRGDDRAKRRSVGVRFLRRRRHGHFGVRPQWRRPNEPKRGRWHLWCGRVARHHPWRHYE